MGYLFLGKEIDGLDRVAGHFMDDIFIRYVMIVNKRATIFDQWGNQLFQESTPLPDNFVPKSLGCIRSAQTGKLIVVAGGFNAGSSKQVTHVLATEYFIQPPRVYQG